MKPVSEATGLRGYLQTMATFSRNAKLFLGYSLLSLLGGGIWRVMFNLYLMAVGFPLDFIGQILAMDFLFHGLFAFPAGLIADKIGRIRTFVVATIMAIVASGALLLTLDPTLLLAFAALRGMGEGFHAVAGAPFMMENSEPRERPHLFSLNAALTMISSTVGNLAGGFLPLLWAAVMGVPEIDPLPARLALTTSLPLTFIALVPLMFMREKPVELVGTVMEILLLRNIVSHGTIAKLSLCSFLVGLGFGFVTPFFNVFFAEVHRATYDQIGLIMGLGSLMAAAAILFSPMFKNRWGMARSIMLTMVVAVPFLMLMVITPSLPLVAASYLLRGAFWSMSMPLRNQLSMEFVVAQERATAAGLIHTCFDIPVAFAAGLAGVMLAASNYLVAFSVAAIVFLIPAPLYYLFFARMEEKEAVVGLRGA